MSINQLTQQRLTTRTTATYETVDTNMKNETLLVKGPMGEGEWVGVPMKTVGGVLVEKHVEISKVKMDKDTVESQLHIEHTLQGYETLPLLALKYGTTELDISRCNSLLGTLDFVSPGTILRIPARGVTDYEPAAPISEKDLALVKFRAMAAPCTKEEAVFYLQDHDYDVRAAYEARKIDIEWEKKHPKKTK